MIKQLNILILTMFGIGNSKFAPGTVASFVTCLIYIWFYNSQVNIFFLIFGVFFIFFFSIYSIDSFKNTFSEIDAKEIVVDEFIGQSIPILTIYNFIEKNNLIHFIFFTFISFIFFRIFDIWKPFPIKQIDEKMKNGFGVILDDIVAGVYSVVLIMIAIFLINYD
ncbi:phosphatidylglycerophosphatase A [Pelagibacteraceae bacterium]|nr:phosphatidylglycerophosphatase A [Pelagibacteraceae bacterium]